MKVKSAQKPFVGRRPKSVADYGIYRSDDRVTVDITRRGKRLRKAFLHSTHGGANPALLALRAWRDLLIASVPAQFKRDIAQRPRRDSKDMHRPKSSGGHVAAVRRRGLNIPAEFLARMRKAPTCAPRRVRFCVADDMALQYFAKTPRQSVGEPLNMVAPDAVPGYHRRRWRCRAN